MPVLLTYQGLIQRSMESPLRWCGAGSSGQLFCQNLPRTLWVKAFGVFLSFFLKLVVCFWSKWDTLFAGIFIVPFTFDQLLSEAKIPAINYALGKAFAVFFVHKRLDEGRRDR